MITRIALTNFRRHADTTVTFDDALLVLIEGANGVGKSTLTEALLWALYGEGREGRSNLDELVRRGGEDEGMSVEVTFTRGDAEYTAARSRRRGHSRATLTLAGTVVADSPTAVTAEVTRLMGVDAAGFRLATYAQQRELDALGSLQPARREAMLVRLLGVDAVTAARNDANTAARTARSALAALGPGDDLGAVTAAAAAVADEVAAARRTRDTVAATLAAADAEIAATEADAAAHAAAAAARAETAAAAAAADERIVRLETALDALPEPGERRPDHDIAAAGDIVDDARRRLDTVRADHGLWLRRQEAEHERAGVLERLAAVLAGVDAAADAAGRAAALGARHAEAVAAVEQQRGVVAERATAVGAARAAAEAARRHADTAAGLGAECGTCGQPVTDTRRATHLADAEAAAEAADVARADAETALTADTALLDRLTVTADILAAQVAGVAREAAVLDTLRSQEAELGRRRDTLDETIGRLPVNAPDVDAAERQLRHALTAAEAAAADVQHNRERDAVLARRGDIETQLADERAARAALRPAAVDPQLADADRRHRAAVDERARAVAELAEAAAVLAVLEERLRAAGAVVDDVRRRRRQREKLTAEAVLAADAAAVLDTVASELTAQIRPAMQAEVSQMLDRLSGGRYSQVRLDENYDVSVADDGDWQRLATLSGGEIDLVALAVRLALATVVAERNGDTGPGFIVLDECFGSQDPNRQASIVAALRALDGLYDQILVISHVPGVRDSVDRVLTLTASVTDGERTARTV